MSVVEYREAGINDREQIAGLIKEHWGSEYIVVHNTIYLPRNLSGFLALEEERIIGLLTYVIDDNNCEIVSLNSLIENRGTGSKLVEFVVEEAKKNACHSVWLITTNDNKKAAAFYEKRGFRLADISAGAVNISREIKPEIPLTGQNGTPITDEYRFVLELD